MRTLLGASALARAPPQEPVRLWHASALAVPSSQATARLQDENKDELMSGDEARLADDEGGLAKAGLTNPLLALVGYDGLPSTRPLSSACLCGYACS